MNRPSVGEEGNDFGASLPRCDGPASIGSIETVTLSGPGEEEEATWVTGKREMRGVVGLVLDEGGGTDAVLGGLG